jgi:hypothetical protein
MENCTVCFPWILALVGGMLPSALDWELDLGLELIGIEEDMVLAVDGTGVEENADSIAAGHVVAHLEVHWTAASVDTASDVPWEVVAYDNPEAMAAYVVGVS